VEEEQNIPTLKKWNERVMQEISDNVGFVPRLSGRIWILGTSRHFLNAPVLCDLCGERMVENPRQLFPTWPYKRLVTCPRCYHMGQRLI